MIAHRRRVSLQRVASWSVAAAALIGSSAQAAILEDFQFGDANGTAITAAVNSANAGNNFLSQNTAINASVQSGSFRIQKGGEGTPVTGQVGNTFNMADVTSGRVWLVANIAGWNYTGTASTPAERVRFGFLDNTDPVAANSSTISAEMNIDRVGNDLQLNGMALGTGSTNIATTLGLSLVRSTPLTLVLELNKSSDQYSVYYQSGVMPFALLGTGDLGASTLNAGDRDANSVRFAFTGTFSEAGEFFDVNRIYVTNDNPIPEPSALALVVAAALACGRMRRR
jgi:hypothetical protein